MIKYWKDLTIFEIMTICKKNIEACKKHVFMLWLDKHPCQLEKFCDGFTAWGKKLPPCDWAHSVHLKEVDV